MSLPASPLTFLLALNQHFDGGPNAFGVYLGGDLGLQNFELG